MVEATNFELAKNGRTLTSTGELLRWLGIRMAAAIEKRRGSVDDWFGSDTEDANETAIQRRGNYAIRFHMTLNRLFKILGRHWRLRPSPIAQQDVDDKWYMVRLLISSFNSTRRQNVRLGQYITVDECMSSWRARTDAKFKLNALPHQVKIARKPQGVGAELKAAADPYSGILMHIELQEGKEAMQSKEMSEELGAGAACTWRMTKHWHGTGRTVVGDSWFGSVKCARALRSVGLYSQFQVKTAHREFPINFLKDWAVQRDQEKDDNGNSIPWGEWKVLRSCDSDPAETYYALCYRDRKPKYLLSNKGTTLQGTPLQVERCQIAYDNDGRPYTNWYIKETPRPQMMQTYWDKFGCIDLHNRRRQGILQIEKYWLTKCWWHRVFGTVGLGMCMVDAFLAYLLEGQSNKTVCCEDDDTDCFDDFASNVAHSLIFNSYDRSPAAMPRQRHEQREQVVAPLSDDHHILRPLRAHARYRNRDGLSKNTRTKLRCRVCTSQAAYYCEKCSTNNYIFACCNPWPRSADDAPSLCYLLHLDALIQNEFNRP